MATLNDIIPIGQLKEIIQDLADGIPAGRLHDKYLTRALGAYINAKARLPESKTKAEQHERVRQIAKAMKKAMTKE